MFEKLNLLYFIIAFSIGIGYVYITSPAPKPVLKFPSPTNAGKVKYSDDSDSCYYYEAHKVKCEDMKNENRRIVPQPVIENFKK